MESRTNKKFEGKVRDCKINLGEFITCVNLFVITLGSYDNVIRMDWLILHDVIRNCKTKILSLIDDLRHNREIVGRNKVYH